MNEVEIMPALVDEASTQIITKGTVGANSSVEAHNKTITLIASNEVQVFVRSEVGKQRIFFGMLHGGDRQLIHQEGSLQISFSDGANLMIEQSDGTLRRPQTAGRGWIRIP